MSVQLTGELVKENYYCAELYYSVCSLTPEATEDIFEKCFRFIDIGMLFTDSMVVPEPGIGTGQPQNIYANPQVSYRIPAIDTLNWIKVEGVFKAKGGEKFLTIGSFEQYDTLTGDVYVLLFFDDVSVKHCGYDTVYPPDSLQIPNVFTPNGDGINEVFEYRNQEQWDFETQVYNRWGGVVYENSSSQNWDGRYKGELVSEGVYFYVIKARAKTTGEEKWYKGTVSVFYN